MKKLIKKALKFYLYANIIFVFGFSLYLFIDDYKLINNNPEGFYTNQILLFELSFIIIYLLVFTFIYWILIVLIILLYNRINKNRNTLQ
jgi:hypothetical protein